MRASTASPPSQGVISLISEWLNNENPEQDLFAVNSMFGAARVIGTAIREVHKIDGGYLQQHEVDFSASFILAGQLKGGQLRLFMSTTRATSSRRWGTRPISRSAR
jgi:putative proteasome-type protease